MNQNNRRSILRNERGVAFPIALLGLLVSSIVVSTMIVTSSTENVVGLAQREAVGDLYAADGAMQAYLSTITPPVQPVSLSGYVAPGSNVPVDIDISQIARRNITGGTESVLFMTARPQRGGRTVTAMLRQSESSNPTMSIESAAVFGGRADISGNSALIHNGGNTDFPSVRSCAAADSARNAIVHAQGSNLTYHDRENITGGIEHSQLQKEALIRQTLGSTIRGLLPRAQIKFGPHFPGAPNWGDRDPNPLFDHSQGDRGTNPSALRTPSVLRDTLHLYNWRCPGRMAADCLAAGADTTTYRIIAIDGNNRDVVVNGDHGQGMLLVINGRLRIQGNFAFKGVIVGEQDIDISGSSGQGGGAKIQGAVISQNNVNVSQQQAANDTTTSISGNAVIVYNRCAINAVANVLNPGGGAAIGTSVPRTFAWAEIVR